MEPITIYAYPVTKSPFSLAECQEKLSPERLEQLSKFPEQSRQHSLAGDLLAMTAYRKAYPGDLFPPERAVTPAGKPYFPARPEFHYSISHSGEWVVCAVGAVPLGVDIQVERPVRPVVFRALSPVEQRELDGLEEQERFPAFFDIWCLKEAYSKAIGLGLKSRFRDFSVSKKAEISVPCFSVALPRFGDCRYHLGICAQTVPMPRLQLQVVEKRELL